MGEGSAWLSEAVARSGGVAGHYQIQAHLAAAHSTAPSWRETDWDRIVGLYDLLGSITANPVVALNRAVAVTERDGPEAGFGGLHTLRGLGHSPPLYSGPSANPPPPRPTADGRLQTHH